MCFSFGNLKRSQTSKLETIFKIVEIVEFEVDSHKLHNYFVQELEMDVLTPRRNQK